jgi:hypothetical protein
MNIAKCNVAGEVLMRGITAYEFEQRREKISPLQLMEALGVACFSRICDFVNSIKNADEP